MTFKKLGLRLQIAKNMSSEPFLGQVTDYLRYFLLRQRF